MREIGAIVGQVLAEMRAYAREGMSTAELDAYGQLLLSQYEARSAPKLVYDFPGYTCISVNHEAAHGIPSPHRILCAGDLVNIDVSAEKNGYFADNGGSFILGESRNPLLEELIHCSKSALEKAIAGARAGVRIRKVGKIIQDEAKKYRFRVIRNLAGHGVGRSLHEDPEEIPCFNDRFNTDRFEKHSVVAIETFISTRVSSVRQADDGWTLFVPQNTFVAQHEHTLVITEGEPIILTGNNGI